MDEWIYSRIVYVYLTVHLKRSTNYYVKRHDAI